jgi:uncharacterized protein (TIGR03084 family)
VARDDAASVFDDLAAEYEQLDAVLAALDPGAWARESMAAGWTIADVVLHLAQTEEYVVASTRGDQLRFLGESGLSVDGLMDQVVAAERDVPAEQIFERWRAASRSALEGLRGCAPTDRLYWVVTPMSPAALATTRIAEHWAHALDVTEPLGIEYPDTNRLRHIAWLAHRTLPYAFKVAGEEPAGPIRCELTGPDGDLWVYGEPDAPSVISGSAGEFCRVGAQRLDVERSALRATGPYAAAALRVVRNYAA